MEMYEIIDFLFLASGIYLIYTAFMARKKGIIAQNVMLDKNTTENKIKDKAGYIDYISKRIMIAGILVVLSAAVNLLNDRYISSIVLNWVGVILILAAIIIYTVAYKNGRKLYIDDN